MNKCKKNMQKTKTKAGVFKIKKYLILLSKLKLGQKQHYALKKTAIKS